MNKNMTVELMTVFHAKTKTKKKKLDTRSIKQMLNSISSNSSTL